MGKRRKANGDRRWKDGEKKRGGLKKKRKKGGRRMKNGEEKRKGKNVRLGKKCKFVGKINQSMEERKRRGWVRRERNGEE